MPTEKEKPLYSIPGVEIFAAGKWNGDEYTDEDLDEMVRAFSETSHKIKPALKLGHSDNQALLQNDGYPAAGWVGKVYRSGSKLLADFVDIPEKIYQLIKQKAYRKVSSEIYWDIELLGKPYRRMLSAVALLGQEMPAVTVLDDILGMYAVAKPDGVKAYAKDHPVDNVKLYSFDHTGGKEMPTEKETQLEAQLAEQKKIAETEAARVAEFSAKVEQAEKAAKEKDSEIETLRKFKEDAEAKAAAAELENQVLELEKQKLIVPAMKEYIKELLGAEKKEYSFGEKKFSKLDLVTEILKLHSVAEKTNTDEQTNASTDAETAKPEEKALNAIREYASKNNCSYGAAYKAVMRAKKEEK